MIYRADTKNSVHATKRIEHIIIPVFNFKGALVESESDKWYPPTSFRLTGGYVTASEAGSSAAILEAWKHTFHTQFDGTDAVDKVLLATVGLSPKGIKGVFGIISGAASTIVTPKDYITIVATNDSGHGGVTVQLFGDKA